MTKLRKQRKRKTYRFDVNRKRLNKKLNRLPKIHCDQLSGNWDKRKSTKVNLNTMGLMYDPNEHIRIPSNKPKSMASTSVTAVKEDMSNVVKELEADAKAPRERNFRLPKTQVQWLSKCLDKYGEDYEAISKDRKLNYMQDTPKQLKAKINVFKTTDQYQDYLNSKEIATSL